MQVKYIPKHGTLKCKTCGKITPRLATSQMFCPSCGLKHKKIMDHKRSVASLKKRKEDKRNEKPPKFYCTNNNCVHAKRDNPIQLDFCPMGTKEERRRWTHYRCPACNSRIGG